MNDLTALRVHARTRFSTTQNEWEGTACKLMLMAAAALAAKDAEIAKMREQCIRQIKELARLRAAFLHISHRRTDLVAVSRNDYDSGYALATEMCCDIADEALAAGQRE